MAFVATTQQHDERATTLLEINPVPSAVMNSQFTDSLPDRADIACQPLRQTRDSGGDKRPDPSIPKFFHPRSERIGLFYIYHLN